MNFYRKICLIMCAVTLLQAVFVPVYADEQTQDVSVISGCNGIDSNVPILGTARLVDNTQSAIVLEATTGTLMYAWNPDQQLHPAGLAKLLTALVAIENGNMQDAVTVKQSVLEQISEGVRTSELQTDEVLTLEQLLYCLIVEGSNDAALVIADHIAGSQEAFVAKMNSYAEELGCTGSQFTNVHGLHDDQQLSTARDMARILERCIQNELFVTVFGTTHYELEATNKSESRSLETSNHMMHTGLYEIYYDSRITGGRTGVNNMGLNHIATTSQNDNMMLICVVMGCESKVNDRSIVEKIGGFDETKQLLDQVYGKYTTTQLFYEGQALKQYSVSNGISDVVVGPQVSLSTVVPVDDAAGTLSYQYKDNERAFEAPIDAGRRMGTVEVWCGSVCLGQADLFAMNDVAINYQIVESKGRTGLRWWGVVLIILLAGCVVATGYMFTLRYRNMKNAAKKRRKSRVLPGRRR